jgi:hypothetical protein
MPSNALGVPRQFSGAAFYRTEGDAAAGNFFRARVVATSTTPRRIGPIASRWMRA